MRITLHKYIFHEIWPTFLTVLMVFIFLVMSTEMLELTAWVINHGVRLSHILLFIFYLLPDIILFSLPATTLMAVFVAFLRLSGSNEILAMKASGLSLYRITLPLLITSVVLAAGNFYYNEYIYPPAYKERLQFKEFTIEL